MALPANWKLYAQSIDERCKDLIDYTIWEGITIDQYKLWKANFKTDEESFLAACMLDSLIYRSNKQTVSMLEDSMKINIKNKLRLSFVSNEANLRFPDCLKDKENDPFIRIVLTMRGNDGPTKGAHIIAREIKRKFRLYEKYFILPHEITEAYLNKGVRTFIFIDDISGTGRTFINVYKECDIEHLQDCYVIFAPLTIHTKAIIKINSKFPNVVLSYTEKLDESHSFFKFGNDSGLNVGIEDIYLRLLKNKLPSVGKEKKAGYGKLGLMYLFQHACPNLSLPVLYHEEDNWQPLFLR